jgi:2TM domain
MSDLPADQDANYQRAYRRARHQVKHLRGWYIHAGIFALVVGAFWLRYLFGESLGLWLNYYRSPRMPLGLTFGWGLGLAIHGMVVWSRFSNFGHGWEERKIQQLMQQQGIESKPDKW